MVEDAIQAKSLTRSCSYSTERLLGNTVQKILMAWAILVEKANLALLANIVSP